jgi:hypothetical protein
MYTSSSGILNNGVMNVTNGGSPFKPDTMTQGNDYSQFRHLYTRSYPQEPTDPSTAGYQYQRGWASSSDYMSRRKAHAVGKSSYKQGLPTDASMAFKTTSDETTRNSALQQTRNRGSVAPRKKTHGHL